MVRRIVRWALWGMKGLLLAVAIGVVFLWGWSSDKGRFSCSRWTWGTGWVANSLIVGGCADGWLGIGWIEERFTGAWLLSTSETAASAGPGWTCKFRTGIGRGWLGLGTDYAWGPIRRHFGESTYPGRKTTYRTVSVPCWLLALAAGAWPVTSLALVVRRRRRARRLVRANCCRRCGYDLRATPGRCPECGAGSAVG